MVASYKRAVIGYKRKEVDAFSASISNQIENIVKDYEKEKESLLEANDKLSKEVEAAENEVRIQRLIQSRLEKELFSGLLEACQKVYAAERQFNDMICSKERMLKMQQDMNDRIITLTDGLLDQIKHIKGGSGDGL